MCRFEYAKLHKAGAGGSTRDGSVHGKFDNLVGRVCAIQNLLFVVVVHPRAIVNVLEVELKKDSHFAPQSS